MRLVSNFCHHSVHLVSYDHCSYDRNLRAVPTIVTAHTFCASRDTRVFLSVMLSNTVIFLRSLKLSVESRSL